MLRQNTLHGHRTMNPSRFTLLVGIVEFLGIYTVDVTNGAIDALQVDPAFFSVDPDWLIPGGLSVSPEGSRITIWGRLKKIERSLR